MVVDLITRKENSLAWDSNKLNNFFLPIDVERILSIPLANDPTPDFLAWLSHWDGIYSVNRGYDFAKYLQDLSVFLYRNLHHY